MFWGPCLQFTVLPTPSFIAPCVPYDISKLLIVQNECWVNSNFLEKNSKRKICSRGCFSKHSQCTVVWRWRYGGLMPSSLLLWPEAAMDRLWKDEQDNSHEILTTMRDDSRATFQTSALDGHCLCPQDQQHQYRLGTNTVNHQSHSDASRAETQTWQSESFIYFQWENQPPSVHVVLG